MKKLLATLAKFGIAPKVAVSLATAAVAVSVAVYGVSQMDTAPVLQPEQQVEESKESPIIEDSDTQKEEPQKQEPQKEDPQPTEKPVVEETEESQEPVKDKEESKGALSDLIDDLFGKKDPEEKVEVSVNPPSNDNDNEPESTPTPIPHYTVEFELGSGNTMEDAVVVENTAISSLDTPNWAEHIFLGWYYDADLTQAVESADKVTKDTTLYASWLEQASLNILEKTNFASALDVAPDFTIKVESADPEMTAEDVKALIMAEDITDSDKATEDIISVTGSDGTYTIKGLDGFREGASYRITLNNDGLNFKGQPETAREYNFTVFREEVQNLAMQSDITYIPRDKLGDIINNGESVATLNLALFESNGTDIAPADMSQGSFDYSGNITIHVGDTVCVYEGEIPTNRTAQTPREQMGDLAYLEITGIEDSTYYYKNADAEDVLFTPDVLPMPENAEDLDNNPETMTVDNKYLDYSADLYAQMNLDSMTTVDVGDFLAFYTGEHGQFANDEDAELTGYGKITKVVENNNETTTITFVEVTWEEVEASMALYAKQEMNAEEMLAGVDTEEMESQIEQQAMDSGFAEEAAMYLASLAMATDNFTALSENMNLGDYKVTLTDGTPISLDELQLMSGGNLSASISKYDVKASIGKNPTHLGDITGTKASKKGVSISLDVTVVFTIDSADSDGQIEITVTGSFTEEIGVDISADGDAEWDWAFCVPYISEYVATANIDVINYTGISFQATMITKGNNGASNSAVDMAREIKDLLKRTTSGSAENGDFQKELVQRYSDMIRADSEWITVVDQNIFNAKINVPFGIPLIRIGFSADFVVRMDASISTGFDFEYTEGNRYAFSVKVFARKTSANTIVLKEKAYGFSFYTLGRLAIRAGVEMEFSAAVISDSVAAIVVEAGAGATTELYGYFFYEMNYTASQGKKQQYAGALMIEVGVYMEADLMAEAAGGEYSANVSLLDKEWQLLKIGSRSNVIGFRTEQKDMPQITLKQHVCSAQIPNSIFVMEHLDLITGEIKYSEYFDDPYSNNFAITMTNKKFAYDYSRNTITVTPDEDDVNLDGEMVITWKGQSVGIASKPIQRRISIRWDNLRDGYMIVADTNGGSYIPVISGKYEAKITKPEDPEKLGYIFAGWYSDESLTTAYTFPEKMPNTDTYIYAKWEAATDTTYRVEHYQEQFASGAYELVEWEDFQGTTDSMVSPATKNYTGFISPSSAEMQIKADGSAVLYYYYNLERHNVVFDAGKVDDEDVSTKDVVYNLKYGAKISAPQMAAKGYSFVGWTTDGTTQATVAQTMGTEDLVYTAMWEKDPDTEYRVEYYIQQTDGSYKLQYLFAKSDFTGTVLNESDLRAVIIDGKTADENYIDGEGIKFGSMTIKGVVCEDGKATVTGDGKLVVKINYARTISDLTFDANGGTPTTVTPVFYQQAVDTPANPTKAGYTFVGWDDLATVEVEAVEPITTMGSEAVTYRAIWSANHYTVRFNKGDDLVNGTMEDQAFLYDAEKLALLPNQFTKTYYDFAGWATQEGGSIAYTDKEAVKNLSAQANGVVDLYAVWTPTIYDVIYHNVDKATHTNPAQYHTESDTITLLPASRTGYTFDGWYKTSDFSGDAVTQIAKGSGGNADLYAKWVAHTNIPYKVEHYIEQLDGTFVLADIDNLEGTSDATVRPVVKDYTGFGAPTVKELLVTVDGQAYLRYDYTRESYTLTFDPNYKENEVSVPVITITAKYEEPITRPAPTRDGYALVGWYQDDVKFEGNTMPAEDLTFKAVWEAGKYTYTVNHHKQNVDGNGYTIETEVFLADMDEEVTPELKTYEGVTTVSTVKTIKISTATNKNVVDYYYDRNQYALSWDINGGVVNASYTEGSVYYGAAITAPVPEKYGYSYSWDKTPVTTMPAKDVSYKAVWTPNIHIVSFDLNGGSLVSGDVVPRSIAFDSAYGELPVLTKTGYTFDGWFTEAEGGSKVTAETTHTVNRNRTLYAQFRLVTYRIDYVDDMSGSHTNETNYSVLTGGITLQDAVKTGYTFLGWYENDQKVDVIPAGSVGDRTLSARWQENRYTVTFHSNNGLNDTIQQTFNYTDSKALTAKPDGFVKAGYEFVGWATSANGAKIYDNEQTVGRLADEDGAEINLYAVWAEGTYQIGYKLVDATTGLELENAVNPANNPTEYSVSNNNFTLEAATAVGYQFHGWYTDADLTRMVNIPLSFSEYHNQTLYAKFIPTRYHIFYELNVGLQPVSGGMMTYGETYSLSTMEDLLPEGRAGYTFLGWALTNEGEVVYRDGESVKNLTVGEEITLYAVWQLDLCDVTYHLGSGADANTLTNPASFSSREITLLNGDKVIGSSVQLVAPAVKPGYEFLGWYNGNNKVDIIGQEAGELYGGNITLTAKWAHSGIYSIAATQETLDGGPSATSGFDATFTVTRTLPEDAVLSDKEQTVWVRTQNGTAYGVDSSAYDISGDMFHFIHTNQAETGSGKLIFGPESSDVQTITVEENDLENAAYMPSSFRIGEVNRYYNIEIYDVTSNGVDGVIDDNQGKVRRDLPVTSYKLESSLYNSKTITSFCFADGSTTASQKGDFKTKEYGLEEIFGAGVDKYGAVSGTRYKTSIKYTNKIAAIVNMKFSNGSSQSKTGNGNQTSNTVYFNSSDKFYVIINPNSGNTVTLKSFTITLDDTSAPRVGFISPLAVTAYKQGEEVMLSVVLNELLNTVTIEDGSELLDLSTTSLGNYFGDIAYVDNGAGTNILVFKATVKKDLTADEVQDINAILLIPYGAADPTYTFKTNIGNLVIGSNVVKDIKNNQMKDIK